jgi:hypothetical protein
VLRATEIVEKGVKETRRRIRSRIVDEDRNMYS